MKLNVTARAARWSALAHWKTATLLWLVFVVGAVVVGSVAGKHGLRDVESSNGETARAEAMLAQAGFHEPAGESVLVQARTGSAPALGREVGTVIGKLQMLPEVRNVHRVQMSADGRSALVELDIRGDASTARTGWGRSSPLWRRCSEPRPRSRSPSSARRAPIAQSTTGSTRTSERAEQLSRADHVPDPAARLRRLRRAGIPGAARVLRGAGLASAWVRCPSHVIGSDRREPRR